MANGLPSGFIVDEPQGLPQGFVVDAPETPEQQLAGAFGDVEQPTAPTQEATEASFAQQLLDTPVVGGLARAAAEAGGGVNQALIDLVDTVGVDTANTILRLTGSEQQIPQLAETELGQAVTQRGFVEGLPGRAIRAAGEVAPAALGGGAAIRQIAAGLPKTIAAVESTLPGVIRQVAKGTAAGDVTLGAASGAGAEAGREAGGEAGALAGAIIAPVGAAGLKTALGAGARGIKSLFDSVQGLSDDGASTLLAEAMVREGVSPDDVARRLAELGPDAIPADVGINFSRLLRTASNKIPNIEGRAAEVFKARQSGQGDRILSAFDDASGTASLSVDDEIARLNTSLKPQIDALYATVRERSVPTSPLLKNLLEGKTFTASARRKAEKVLSSRRALGDKISNIDVIDATKQQLDDEIGKAVRAGEGNKVRNLVREKNVLVNEADKAIPEYKQARDLFAGKASLENAADAGTQFIKLKPRDIQDLTKTMGESELRMFKLGAKRSILDKIDDVQTGADLTKRLFGKGGDVKKLRGLFDTKEQFDQFSNTLEKEAQFVLTRRAAQANSTTAKQLSDEVDATETLKNAIDAISTPVGAANVLGRILGGLGRNKSDEAFTKALEGAGDILLAKGMNPDRLSAILRRGTRRQVEKELRMAMRKELKAPRAAPVTTGAVVETVSAPEERQ